MITDVMMTKATRTASFVRFEIREGRVHGEPDAHRTVDVPFTRDFVLQPIPEEYSVLPADCYWCPERNEYIAFCWETHFEGTYQGCDYYCHGPYRLYSGAVSYREINGIPSGSQSVTPTLQNLRKERAAASEKTIFLCHAMEDKESIRHLYWTLKQKGFTPWLDEIDILPGVEWERAIREAIRQSRIVLACLSGHSISKTGFVQKELRFALDRTMEFPEGYVYIIPIRLQECRIPDSLSKWQALDYFRENGTDRLIQVIEHHLSN